MPTDTLLELSERPQGIFTKREREYIGGADLDLSRQAEYQLRHRARERLHHAIIDFLYLDVVGEPSNSIFEHGHSLMDLYESESEYKEDFSAGLWQFVAFLAMELHPATFEEMVCNAVEMLVSPGLGTIQDVDQVQASIELEITDSRIRNQLIEQLEADEELHPSDAIALWFAGIVEDEVLRVDSAGQQ